MKLECCWISVHTQERRGIRAPLANLRDCSSSTRLRQRHRLNGELRCSCGRRVSLLFQVLFVFFTR